MCTRRCNRSSQPKKQIAFWLEPSRRHHGIPFGHAEHEARDGFAFGGRRRWRSWVLPDKRVSSRRCVFLSEGKEVQKIWCPGILADVSKLNILFWLAREIYICVTENQQRHSCQGNCDLQTPFSPQMSCRPVAKFLCRLCRSQATWLLPSYC